MSELKRQRAARDLWVSKGQVAAAGVSALFLCVLAFAGGMAMGRSSAGPTVPPELAQLSEGDLLELIARVEATAQVGGPLDKLTFPDALRGDQAPAPLPHPDEAQRGGVTVAPPVGGDVLPDLLPGSIETVVVVQFASAAPAIQVRDGLRAVDGMQAWLGKSIVDGVATYSVLVPKPVDSSQ